MAGKKKFVLGAFLGMAAGAVAGVLLAPKSGKETRDDLAEKAEELKTMTPEEIKEKALVKAEELKEKALEKAEELKDKVAVSLDEAKDQLEHIDFDEVRQSMEQKRSEIATKIKQSTENLGETLSVDELASASPVVKTISEDSEEEELSGVVADTVETVDAVVANSVETVASTTEDVVATVSDAVPSEDDLRETLTKKVNEFKSRVGEVE